MYFCFLLVIVISAIIIFFLYKKKVAIRYSKAMALPFLLLFKHKLNLFIWLMFVIVGGQLGTIFNLISRCFIHQQSFQEALAQDSATGSFYIFSIVMYASLIGPLFIQVVNPKQPSYRYISVVLLTLLIFALLFSSVFYAYVSQLGVEANLKTLNESQLPIDHAQLIFFFLAIIFSLYSLGFYFFNDHVKETENISDDSWVSNDNKEVNQMTKRAKNMNSVTNKIGDLKL